MEYFKNNMGNYEKTTEEYATHVMISTEEFNGYEKAVRIVRDRALQQVDKAKADEHGYTLLHADQREYKNKYGYGGMAWVVTRRSPYAVKMDVEDAVAMINRDMRDYYLMRDRPSGISIARIVDYHNRFFETGYAFSDEAYSWMAETGGKVTLEMTHIHPNYAAGCYEVSYLATEPM